MNELINIAYNSDKPTVSARNVYETLGIKKRFSEWFETNAQGFIENEDFTSVLISTEVPNNGGFQKRELQDYAMTVEMAKHICLMSRTEKGKQARQYLITVENNWNSPDKVMARALILANKNLDELKGQNKQLLIQASENKDKVIFADAVGDTKTTILIGELAKLLKQNGIDIGQNRLYEQLRKRGFLIKKKGSDYNLPTQKAMNLDLFRIKESNYSNKDGITFTTKTTKVTGKGQQYFISMFLKG